MNDNYFFEMPTRVLIPDFGMGNLHSVERSLCRMNVSPIVSSDPAEIAKADKIILPGVGHFKKAMENLAATGMIEPLNEFVITKKKPILGICLGMQLMANKSEEGNVSGLGWINAEVIKFRLTNTIENKILHIGWNKTSITTQSPLFNNIPNLSEFYFIHGYHFGATNHEYVIAETTYEDSFPSAIAKENIFGVQFHPEKSHEFGATLIKNFIAY